MNQNKQKQFTIQDNNKRIAKNTMLLYVRMLLTLLVSLYTSRVLLEALGINDYGVYNIVGGIVVLFSFLSNAMTGATQRYLNYNVGLNDKGQLSKIFSSCLQAHFIIAVFVLILAETIGLWFVIEELNIPHERLLAAQVVYHFSVITTCINIVRVPYNAAVIAYEKMSFFAYMSIIESILKLLIIYLLLLYHGDKLILYSFLLTAVSFVIWFVYRAYSRKHYEICKYKDIKAKSMLRELLSFTSWFLLGGAAVVGAKQGLNILLNIFHGVSVNAAVGISNQVNSAVYGFVTNFQTAFNPQLVKLYAQSERKELFKLMVRATKFSFFMLFIMSLPIMINCREILHVWLVNIPDYTVSFTILTILISYFDTISAPLWTIIGATGKVRNYQLFVSLILFLSIPISYLILQKGTSPVYVFYVNMVINFSAYLYRLFYCHKYIKFRLLKYLQKALMPCIVTAIPAVMLSLVIDTYLSWFYSSVSIVFLTAFSIYFLGLANDEKAFIHAMIFKVLKK